MPQCPRCANREDILSDPLRGSTAAGQPAVGSQYFCPKCKLLETAIDGAANARLVERWNPPERRP
jgi:hypothetical protein